MQAHLSDLASEPESPHFRTCQRVYNRCQRILFEDPDPEIMIPDRHMLPLFHPFFEVRRKMWPGNTKSALAGMASAVLAIGRPDVAQYGQNLALQQGRLPPSDLIIHQPSRDASAASASSSVDHPPSEDTEHAVSNAHASSTPTSASLSIAAPSAPEKPPASPVSPSGAAGFPDDRHAPLPREPPATFASAQQHDTKPDPVQQVFGQDDSGTPRNAAPLPLPQPLPSTPTTPSAPTTMPSHTTTTSAPPPLNPNSHEYALHQKYLCSHYGRTEMQFLQALQDIPTRLQQLPKPARLSALRAELTSLNRTLPAEVCFPTWCAGSAAGSAHPERHHRVMRISASEAVVLNSADRVPYLLHVEVLRNDLDFDPNRRYNRELLQSILQNRDRSLRPLLMAHTKRPSIPLHPGALSDNPAPGDQQSGEVDLTEQMYGSDLSAFGKVHEDVGIQEEFGTKNDTLDTAAWAHASNANEQRADFSLDEYSQRMRTAAVMLAQLNKGSTLPRTAAASDAAEPGNEPAPTRVSYADAQVIRQRIMDEMTALEEQRMKRMKRGGQFFTRRKRNMMGAEDESAVLKAVNKDDPSAAYFRESWTIKKDRIRASSPYGSLPGWDLFSVIVKTGADLRQELFAVQLIHEFKRVWSECRSSCWVHYFRIVTLNESAGLIETITDAISVHSIKKAAYASQMAGQPISTYTLYDYFVQTYGDPHLPRFRRARRNFMESLAGYAIVSYLLQIKDRHNGNILVDADGHLIHIDFGFILGLSPGGVGFEAAPFKFPRDYIDILGGMDSDGYNEFKALMRQGFRDVRKHAERFILLVELMQRNSHLPCFAASDNAAAQLRDRFQLNFTSAQCDEFVDKLVLSAAGSAFTRLYDQYQNFTQSIL